MDKIKVCMTPWHVMHYADLINALGDYVDFTFIDNAWRSWRDERFLSARPLPANVSFAPFYEKGKYDLAILSIDQQCMNPVTGKWRVYSEFNEAINDIPKIVINHGTPIFPEYFKLEGMNDLESKAACVAAMKIAIGNNHMVVNSYKAAEDWTWGNPIWHGMDIDDWKVGEKEPRVITALSPGGLGAYYNRDCMDEVLNLLEEKTGYHLQWARVTKYADTGKSLDKYKNFLSKGLIYLDTSIETPMNRARTEAMLSGCCVVQVKGAHDLEKFAIDGNNMVLVENNPNKIVDRLAELLNNPDSAKEIGERGRITARELFNYNRYRNDWLNLLNSIL